MSTHPIIPQVAGQDLFAEKMRAACDQVEFLIQKRTPFAELIRKIGELRCNIAEEMQTEYMTKFGKPRVSQTDRISTTLIGPYEHMKQDVVALEEQNPTIKWEIFTPFYRTGFRLGVCQDEPIQLTRYLVDPEGECTIAHTYPENLPAAFGKMKELYQSLFDPQKMDPDQILSTSAKIHWWLVQTAPYFRGSASGGELIANALHKHFFKKYIFWEEKVFPDRIALMKSEEEFVNLYPSLIKQFAASGD